VAKKGQSRHLKRFALPAPIKIPRKSAVWAVKSGPGPHPAEGSAPLLIVVRDLLGLARTAREAKRILKEGQVLVDGRVRKDPKFPVGLMDVVQIPAMGKNYRVLYDRRGQLKLNEISDEEASFKLCKVVGKSMVKGGKIQLAFHDGKTSIGDFEDFHLGDTAKVTLPDFRVSERIGFEKGAKAIIIGGRNVGKVGEIEGIRCAGGRRAMEIVDLRENGTHFQASRGYVFAIGKKEPLISIPGD